VPILRRIDRPSKGTPLNVASSDRKFEAIVIGEPQPAFYGNQFGLTFQS
jgi:hypothetical protein